MRISEHEPRKGTETYDIVDMMVEIIKDISEHEPRKGTETPSTKELPSGTAHFQNVNPERGRKQGRSLRLDRQLRPISEREPRKGTETFSICSNSAKKSLHFRT